MTDISLSRRGSRARLICRAGLVGGIGLLLANCASQPAGQRQLSAQNQREIGAFSDSRKYGRASPRVVQYGENVPKGGGRDHLGKPYRVAGRWYTPRENPDYSATGNASWYGDAFHGRKTANGEVYDKYSYTAAHPTMPLPSYARVTNMSNGRSIIVRVNDRGPFHGGRIIDVSERVAHALNFKHMGTARVKVDYVRRAGLAGSDDRQLVATLRTDGAPAQLDGYGLPAGNVLVAGTTDRSPAFSVPSATSTRRAPGAVPSAVVLAEDAGSGAVTPVPVTAQPRVTAVPVQVAEAAPVARAGVARPPDRPFDLGVTPGAGEITPRVDTVARARPASPAVQVAAAPVTAVPLAQASPTLSFAGPAERPSRSAVPVNGAQMAALYYAPASGLAQAFGQDDPTRRIRPGMQASAKPAARTVTVGLFRDPANVARLERALAGSGQVVASRVTVAGAALTRLEVRGLSEAAAQDVLGRARRAGATDARVARP
jgi:rare lipoprotein A